jgi:glycoprotein endo-alpha-1,2-mannosidase
MIFHGNKKSRKNSKKNILKKLSAPLILILLLVFVFLCYLLESRLFLIGKVVYPVYTFVEKAVNGLKKDTAAISDTIVYCDYYTWHSPPNWDRGYSDMPLLGLYDSLDDKVIKEHIGWANEYGIDVLKVEYIPQFDETITSGILNYDLGDTRLCLMYDSRLRFESVGYKKPPYDFNDEVIKKTFLDDLNHIADTYFASDNYFKINGRPVLWIYITRDFTGNYKSVIGQARQNLKNKGFDVYLVGDQVFYNYSLRAISAFDAVSCYSAYAGRPQNTADFGQRLKFLYMVWKTAARMAGKDFIPSGIPAYDDSCLENERKSLPVLSGTAQDFNFQLQILSNLLDPVNIDPEFNQVSIATFNEHQEGTSVEPSEDWGFSRIEQIPIVFGSN